MAADPALVPDFRFTFDGSVALITPMSEAARAWLEANVDPDATYFAESLVVEPRYVTPILEGIREDGLSIIRGA